MTELTFKQAQVEMRQLLRVFRAFENVEAILAAAGEAAKAQASAEERLKMLQGELFELGGTVSAARTAATLEQTQAAIELERLRERHFDSEAKFKAVAEETAAARDRRAQEKLTELELHCEQVQEEIAKLEDEKEALEKKLEHTRAEYAAMLKRLGVGDARL